MRQNAACPEPPWLGARRYGVMYGDTSTRAAYRQYLTPVRVLARSRPGVTRRADGPSEMLSTTCGTGEKLPPGGVNQKNSEGGSAPGSAPPVKLTTDRKVPQSNGSSPRWCRSVCQSRICCSSDGFDSISSDMLTSRNMVPSSGWGPASVRRGLRDG